MEKPKIDSGCGEVVGIVRNEKDMDILLENLFTSGFDHHEISVMGSPKELKSSLGKRYVNPIYLEHNPNTPRHEMILPDDFSWWLAFIVATPMFIGMVLGIGLYADFRFQNYYQIFSYATIGGIFGLVVGFVLAFLINRNKQHSSQQQQKVGGFVIWITTIDPERVILAEKLLTEHGAYAIHCSALR